VSEGCDVLLINPPYPRRFGGGIVPPIGLCYLAAALRRIGVVPQILDLAVALPEYRFADGEKTVQLVRTYLRRYRRNPPKLIGVGPVVTATLRAVRQIVTACRTEVASKVIVGGPLCSVPGISAVARDYLGVDAYVAGDGESPISEVWKVVASSTDFVADIPGVGLPGGKEPPPHRELDL